MKAYLSLGENDDVLPVEAMEGVANTLRSRGGWDGSGGVGCADALERSASFWSLLPLVVWFSGQVRGDADGVCIVSGGTSDLAAKFESAAFQVGDSIPSLLGEDGYHIKIDMN